MSTPVLRNTLKNTPKKSVEGLTVGDVVFLECDSRFGLKKGDTGVVSKNSDGYVSAKMDKDGSLIGFRVEENPFRKVVTEGGETGSETERLDAEYMEAVRKGDLVKCASMVEAAAKRNLRGTQVIDKDRNLLKVYHSSRNKNLKSFDLGFVPAGNVGFHFGPKEIADVIHRTKPGNHEPKAYYLDILNPMTFSEDCFGTSDCLFNELAVTGEILNHIRRGGRAYGELRKEFERMDAIVNDDYDSKYTDERYGYSDPKLHKLLIDTLYEAGYDGIVYANSCEGSGDICWIALDPHQVKSADPITYYGDGTVVPLSKRFDTYSEMVDESRAGDDVVVRISALVSKYDSGDLSAKGVADGIAELSMTFDVPDPVVRFTKAFQTSVETLGADSEGFDDTIGAEYVDDIREWCGNPVNEKAVCESDENIPTSLSAEDVCGMEEMFGTTNDVRDAYFIMPDGKWLDFSTIPEEKCREHSFWGPEHPLIGLYYGSKPSSAIRDAVVKLGLIRVIADSKYSLIEIGNEPTGSQISSLREFLDALVRVMYEGEGMSGDDPELIVEIDHGKFSRKYNVDQLKFVVRDIEKFFGGQSDDSVVRQYHESDENDVVEDDGVEISKTDYGYEAKIGSQQVGICDITVSSGERIVEELSDSVGYEPGFREINPNKKTAYIEDIAVDPEVRNCGIGTNMMKRIVGDYGSCQIVLRAFDTDGKSDPDRLVGFYMRFGFYSIASTDNDGIVMLRRADSPKTVVKESSDSDDDAYLAAAKTKNVKLCRKMVDEKAKKAFAGSRLVTKEGMPIKLYHGTAFNIHKFEGGLDTITWVTPDIGYADVYADYDRHLDADNDGVIMSLYVYAKNMVDIGDINEPFSEEGVRRIAKSIGCTYDELKASIGKYDYDFLYEINEYVASIARKKGIDILVAKEGDLDRGVKRKVVTIGVLNFNSIKSADPITKYEDGTIVPLSKRFDFGTDDIREDAEDDMYANRDSHGEHVNSDSDAAYMDAVKRGDMATAQRMVREAAAKAMPDTKVVDKDGLPKIMYHGTNAKTFNSFDTTEDGLERKKNEGAWNAEYPDGTMFFISTRNGAKYYGKSQVPVFLNLPYAEVRTVDRGESLVKPIDDDGLAYEYGDVVITDGRETVACTSNEYAIKSALPATYDDDGNVIPLSKRFNFSTDDIREDTEESVPPESAAEVPPEEKKVELEKPCWKNPDDWKKDEFLVEFKNELGYRDEYSPTKSYSDCADSVAREYTLEMPTDTEAREIEGDAVMLLIKSGLKNSIKVAHELGEIVMGNRKGGPRHKKLLKAMQKAYHELVTCSARFDNDEVDESEESDSALARWFRSSVVKDASGQPLVVYHGSSKSGITEFNEVRFGNGIFFTSSKEVANDYAVGKENQMYPCYLRIEHPFVIDAHGSKWSDMKFKEHRAVAKHAGYRWITPLEVIGYVTEVYQNEHPECDGIVIRNVIDTNASNVCADDYIVFDPKQIKSVDNCGSFSDGTANIFESR